MVINSWFGKGVSGGTFTFLSGVGDWLSVVQDWEDGRRWWTVGPEKPTHKDPSNQPGKKAPKHKKMNIWAGKYINKFVCFQAKTLSIAKIYNMRMLSSSSNQIEVHKSQGHPELSTRFPVNTSLSPNLPHWHLVWAWTNGKTCNLIFAITELKQHVLSLVQTTIGFGDPCRTGSCSPQTKPSYKRLRDSLLLCW